MNCWHINTYSERTWKLRIFFHSLAHDDISNDGDYGESVCVFYAQCSARLTESINTFVFECIAFDFMTVDITANQFRAKLCKCVQCALCVVFSYTNVLYLHLMNSRVDYIHMAILVFIRSRRARQNENCDIVIERSCL